jgi:hypothetical protein
MNDRYRIMFSLVVATCGIAAAWGHADRLPCLFFGVSFGLAVRPILDKMDRAEAQAQSKD